VRRAEHPEARHDVLFIEDEAFDFLFLLVTRDFFNAGELLEEFSNCSVSLDQGEKFVGLAGLDVSGMQCDVFQDYVSNCLLRFRVNTSP
jgi:hypothetical protein